MTKYQIKLMKFIGDVSYNIGRLSVVIQNFEPKNAESTKKSLQDICTNLDNARKFAIENESFV